jgi:MFS family permease
MGLARGLAGRLPFHYQWVVLGCTVCASFARQATAVAVLSVFVVPMCAQFDWTRAQISGAVSLGGIMAAAISPWLGALVDRHGARVVLGASSLAIAATALALSATHSLLWFYLMFSLGRMIFASPFDLGISAAVANWFLRRRALAMSVVSLATGLSLAIMPFIAQLAIDARGWRMGWVAVAIAVLVVGFLPNALLMARRPEDLGLRPDPPVSSAARSLRRPREISFTREQALRTPALWLLMAYSGIIFMVQAGISLHQAPHMIQRGLDPTAAASVVSTFALVAAGSAVVFGTLAQRIPVRISLALAASIMGVGAGLMQQVDGLPLAFTSAAVFGCGIGGILTLVPVAFADYFGRHSYGAIRGLSLTVQITGQALGPLLSGVLFDLAGDYRHALTTFAVLAFVAAATALAARPPAVPVHAT